MDTASVRQHNLPRLEAFRAQQEAEAAQVAKRREAEMAQAAALRAEERAAVGQRLGDIRDKTAAGLGDEPGPSSFLRLGKWGFLALVVVLWELPGYWPLVCGLAAVLAYFAMPHHFRNAGRWIREWFRLR